MLRPRARCSSPRPAPRHCINRRRAIRQMYRGADGRGVSFHHGVLVATAFFWGGCFVLTTPNEIIAHTLHFVSRLGINRVYQKKKEGCSKGGGNGRRGRGSGQQGAKYRSTNEQPRMPPLKDWVIVRGKIPVSHQSPRSLSEPTILRAA